MCDNVSLLLVMHEYVHHVVGHVCAFHGYYTCVPLPEFTSMTFVFGICSYSHVRMTPGFTCSVHVTVFALLYAVCAHV
jgi:hypothetical protein